MNFSEIARILFPEFLLTLGILLTLVMSLCEINKKHVATTALVFLALAALSLTKDLIAPQEAKSILFNSFSQDSLSVYFRFLIYAVSFLIAFGSSQYLCVLESPGEYYPILLAATLGAGMLTAANDFLFFFVALETLGLSAILLVAYARRNQGSNEAGIKYLINSAIATSILLLGISFIYGLTGLTNFNAVALRLYQLNIAGSLSPSVLVLIGVCLVASIAFKLAAAPFHNWSPDVYQGAPTTTTVFLSVVSKTAAFGLAIRLFGSVFNNDLVTLLLAAVAVLSIVIGNYVGIIQIISRGSLKRLLAYSSIAQAGYLIIGLAVFNQESIGALVLYLTVYALMNTGAFLGAIYFESLTGSDSIYDLSGLIKKRPLVTVCMSLCLINLAGLPFIPAGFIAKFFLFAAAYSSGLNYGPLLALAGLIGSVIALYYYLYLVKIMVVDSPSTAVTQLPEKDSATAYPLLQLSLVATTVLLAGFGIFGMDVFRTLAAEVVAGL